MNIKEAKETIQYTLQAYFQKDENGYPLVPLRQQRPILLIGPPGIGKTAIMEQIAGECGAGLVAYTMTHHTRQSAMGLPKIVERTFDDAQVSSVSLLLDGRPYVTMGCDDFPYLAVWTIEDTHPFVCLEPWYGICASEGYKGELKDRKGIISLPGWESWSKSYTIQVG